MHGPSSTGRGASSQRHPCMHAACFRRRHACSSSLNDCASGSMHCGLLHISCVSASLRAVMRRPARGGSLMDILGERLLAKTLSFCEEQAARALLNRPRRVSRRHRRGASRRKRGGRAGGWVASECSAWYGAARAELADGTPAVPRVFIYAHTATVPKRPAVSTTPALMRIRDQSGSMTKVGGAPG